MRPSRMAATLALLGAACGGGVAAARTVEGRASRAVERAAASMGASIRSVQFSWFGPLRLEGVVLQPDAATRLTVEAAEIEWRMGGGADARAHVSSLALSGMRLQRGALALALPAATFDVLAWEGRAGAEHVRLRQRTSGGTIDARWAKGATGREAELALAGLDLSAGAVEWDREPVLELGRWSGRLAFSGGGTCWGTAGRLWLEEARGSLGRALGLADGPRGAPTEVELAWSARRRDGAVEIEQATARMAGIRLEGRGRFRGPDAQGEAELSAQVEVGDALRTAGLRLPEPVHTRPDARLGTAWFDVTLRGPLGDAAALRVVPRLRFESTPEAERALAFLNHPFRHAPQPSGTRIDVSAGAPDFVPLAEVPSLFVRMLLLSEDAGFFGHPGIDVAEIPAAWTANAERGAFARGASTITQQLARNLFLARDKSYGRKLEEAALALMLDAAVPKTRILEIYLNVIEWGPDLHGLAPAAWHYFGKHPSQLTTKEMAFLVCLVPSPVRYHSAHRAGHVGPGMEQLMQNLLAKMRARDGLGEDEYERARYEELVFRPEGDDTPPGVVD